MEELEYIVIDGKEYGIVEKLDIDNTIYAYLINLNDNEDIIIKKVINEKGEEYLTGLDSEIEFNKALMRFTEKELKNSK